MHKHLRKSSPQKQSSKQSTTPDVLNDTEQVLQRAQNHPETLTRHNVIQLQRMLGNQAVQRLMKRQQPISASKRNSIQREPVKTKFGVYADEQYEEMIDETIEDSNEPVTGLKMKLTFEPNRKVNATKIGLTQIAKSVTDGTPEHMFPEQEEFSTDSGFHVDARQEDTNPIYGATTEEDQKLEDTPMTDNPAPVGDDRASMYQLGFHYKEGKEKKHQKAEMFDRPRLSQPPPNSGQEFETTAVAIDGEQAGAYYGSVSWGWKTDGDGNFTRLPLELVSKDGTSDEFAEAVELWNDYHDDAKITEPDSEGNATVKEDIDVKSGNQQRHFTIAKGTKLNIDVNNEPHDGMMFVKLEDTINLSDGGSTFITHVPLDKMTGNRVNEDIDVERIDTFEIFVIKAGSVVEVLNDKPIGNQVVVKLKDSTVSAVETEMCKVWISRRDAFGFETIDLPVPGEDQ